MCFFGIMHILFPLSDGFSVTSVSGYKQRGHNPVEEFTALSMSIHPHQCPFLTVLLWSFSALIFWSMYAGCLRQSSTERIQTRRTQDLFPLRLLLQAHRVPKHHKSPITTEQSYSGTFVQGISGRVLSLICICWCVCHGCSNLIIPLPFRVVIVCSPSECIVSKPLVFCKD